MYNQNNWLIRVEEDLDILGEYTYNGLGQRAIKAVDGVTTVFHYDFDGNIIAESLSDGTMTAEYLYIGGSDSQEWISARVCCIIILITTLAHRFF